ncbi:hypothetical protein DL95DRAFT_484322 [Leptodontidium sp. 2 PMI_412]|nr:hypothetical protein DL95DRAFT_484322 [Leptodontidium sp. 2 PMI_412]
METDNLGPLVQFARFVNGRLETFPAHTRRLQYYAISHVWGKTEWLQVNCLCHDILASLEKARFINEQLPALVGSTAFWMDTLTVNQRDPAEVIATVQSIPAIFRDAQKTIAVREEDGIYDCCEKAVRGFADYEELVRKLIMHIDEHDGDDYRESYLQRLWTLQEVLLSRTIQFVISERKKLSYEERHQNPYWYRENVVRVLDSLYGLAHAFEFTSNDGSLRGITDFMKAYICSGTVTSERRLMRGANENIFTNSFANVYASSIRSATEPRDYIFATMPQFPWYHYPEEAARMTFNEIFLNFYEQSTRNGHRFACRITRSMITIQDCHNADHAWHPSGLQPEPVCLGDFLKLLGQPLEGAIGSENDYHFATTTTINEIDLGDGESISTMLDILEAAMRFSPETWVMSHRGGELAKYGAWPESYDSFNRYLLKTCLEVDESEQDLDEIARIRALVQDEEHRQNQDDWIIPQSMKLLNMMFASVDKFQQNLPMQGDWNAVKGEMQDHWAISLRQKMVLLAAMVSCRIPLSAVHWASEHLRPVRVQLNGMYVLGLLANHYTSTENEDKEVGWKMFCGGRHVSRASRGKDLALVDPATKMPVGLLPDFADNLQTEEEFVKRMSVLYNGLVTKVGSGNSLAIMNVPLSMANLTSRGT